jgi:hypothetical protein
MAAAPVEYRHEYVSGIVVLRAFPAWAEPVVVNRGHTEEFVRARIWLPGSKEPFGDTGDGLVKPNESSGGPSFFDGGKSESEVWVQIFTTSPNLVPALAFREARPSPKEVEKGEVGPLVLSLYFAPGDFAAFALHPPVVHPPHLPGGPRTTS